MLFVSFGALAGWAGWLGLAFAVVGWVGLVGLGRRRPPAPPGHGGRARRGAQRRLPGARRADGAHLGPLVARHPGHPAQGRGPSRPPRTSTTGATAADATASTSTAPGWPRPAGAPVMVYIHGGAWVIGDKREQGKPMMYELVARGWVCVAINYRLSPKATWPDHIVDVKRAVAWVKEHIAEYGGDPVVRRRQRRVGRRPPLCAAGAERRRPRLPARVRGGGHVGRGLRPLLRRHGHDRLPRGRRPLRPRPARDAGEARHEDQGGRAPRGLPRRLADLPGPRRCTAVLRPARAGTTPWSRSRWPARSSPRLRAVSAAPVAYAELPAGPACLRRAGLAALPGHDRRRRRLPRGGPGCHAAGRPAATDATAARNVSDIESDTAESDLASDRARRRPTDERHQGRGEQWGTRTTRSDAAIGAAGARIDREGSERC